MNLLLVSAFVIAFGGLLALGGLALLVVGIVRLVRMREESPGASPSGSAAALRAARRQAMALAAVGGLLLALGLVMTLATASYLLV